LADLPTRFFVFFFCDFFFFGFFRFGFDGRLATVFFLPFLNTIYCSTLIPSERGS